MHFDENSDAKTIMSCSCPAYTFDYLPCKHMFLLARWDTAYTVNGDYRPTRLIIDPNTSTSQSLPLPGSSPNPSNVSSSASSSDPSSSAPAPTGRDAPLGNPRDAMKAVINKFKRTFEQSAFSDHRLLEIVSKFEGLHSELQQAIVLPPNARLQTQHRKKKTRTRK